MVIPFFISLYPTISHYITTFSDAIFWGTQNSAMSFPSISLRGWRSPGSFPLPKYLAGHHIRCTAMTWIWWNWRFLHGYYDTNHGKTMVCGAPHSPVFPEKILRNVRIGKNHWPWWLLLVWLSWWILHWKTLHHLSISGLCLQPCECSHLYPVAHRWSSPCPVSPAETQSSF